MSYKKIQPEEILKPYIETIWVQEDLTFDPNWKPTKIIPSTRADLIFYYHDPFVQHNKNSKEIIPMNVLHGQFTKPIEVSATGKTGLIILSFYPWGISPFINIPYYELTDKAIDIKLLYGSSKIDKLHSKIMEAKDIYVKIKHIQEFLINILKERQADLLVIYLTKLINNSFGKIKLSEAASHLNISRRHLQRRFSTATGLSPKQFVSIVRFQKALFLKRNGYHWGDIAEHCGYYDQSHFIKEIKTYTDKTPEDIYSDVKPTKLMKYFNSFNSMSHFYNTVYL